MGRLVRDYTPIAVDSLPVANHRYYFDGVVDADGNRLGSIDLTEDYKEARACIPYKAGEVVYVENDGSAIRALIRYAGMDRNRFGDWREWYQVQFETKNGTFSKLWNRVYPGFVQRGYEKMGYLMNQPAKD